jgi:hypothetical protein
LGREEDKVFLEGNMVKNVEVIIVGKEAIKIAVGIMAKGLELEVSKVVQGLDGKEEVIQLQILKEEAKKAQSKVVLNLKLGLLISGDIVKNGEVIAIGKEALNPANGKMAKGSEPKVTKELVLGPDRKEEVI